MNAHVPTLNACQLLRDFLSRGALQQFYEPSQHFRGARRPSCVIRLA